MDENTDVWNKLKLRDKMRFFNLWIILTIVGNLCQIIGVVTAFIDSDMLNSSHQAVVGFGCWCAWVNVVRYLENSNESYALVHALQRSLGNLLWYFIGIVPIYMGFVFLGMSIFWNCGYFQNVVASMATTYAFLNGDTVYNIFTAIQQENYFFGLLYSFFFILFFICCVQNLTIAMIQEGYQSLKENPVKNEFDLDEETDDSNKSNVRRVNTEVRQSVAASKEAFKKLVGLTSPRVSEVREAEVAPLRVKVKIEAVLEEIASVSKEDDSMQMLARIQIFKMEQLPDMLQFYRRQL
mmetsp:Transcript_34557/g.60659  ORF Transcript_34557/g.60659 Transcript_34557/m.60659 type:complete len:295 (+) Transcript_34557:2777-3661(+)